MEQHSCLFNGFIQGNPVCPECGRSDRGMLRYAGAIVIENGERTMRLHWECNNNPDFHLFSLKRESHFTHCIGCEGRGYFEGQDNYEGRGRWNCRECNGRGWLRI